MASIDKSYSFIRGEDEKFFIDSYQNHSYLPSLEIDHGNNIVMKNTSNDKKTNNFYGDARLGDVGISNSVEVRLASFYFTEALEHPVYGWILSKVWYANGTFSPGDEIVLYKKHIKEESFFEELGQWELATFVEAIVDADGTHYKIETNPAFEWSTRTANSGSIVLQYNRFTVLQDKTFEALQLSGTSPGYVAMPATLWSARVVSHPFSILYIKAAVSVTIEKNARIISGFGYNGGHDYGNNYYNTWVIKADPGAPLGCGVENGVANSAIRDPRSPGSGRWSTITDMTSYAYGAGGPGNNGLGYTNDTKFSKETAFSPDLNQNIYCGIGGTQYQYNNTGGAYFNYRGRAGGGILIIQTPLLEFKDTNSKISTRGTEKEVLYPVGFGGGGSILVKAEEIVFHKNPSLSTHYNDENTYLHYNIGTGNDPVDTYINLHSAPGQIQLEFDRLKTLYELDVDGNPLVYTPSTVPDLFISNHIFDPYAVHRKTLKAGLAGTETDWSYDAQHKKLELHSFSAPIYETGRFYKLYTKGVFNINIDGWYDIFQFYVDAVETENTQIRIVLSIDQGISWRYIDMTNIDAPVLTLSSLSELDLAAKSNTIAELNAFDNRYWLINNIINPQKSNDVKSIDFCFAFKTSVQHIGPKLNHLWISFERAPKIEAPIPIKPFNGEEFNNEYVNFVWLQPVQRTGSLQNRIEISSNPTFSREALTIDLNDGGTSTYNGNLVLPYQAKEVSNYFTELSYLKTPYLKQRGLPLVNAEDSNYPSVISDDVARTVSYYGNDIFFLKGTEISTTPLAAPLAYPTEMDFKIDLVTSPKAANIISYIDFTGVNSVSEVIDQRRVWDSYERGTGFLPKDTYIHGKVIAFENTANHRFSTVWNPANVYKDVLLNGALESTEYIRFNTTSIAEGTTWLFSKSTSPTSTSNRGVFFTKSYVNGKEHIRLVYKDGSTVYYATYGYLIVPGTENVIVLKNFSNNTTNIYLNGNLVLLNKRKSYNVSFASSNTNTFYYTFGGFLTENLKGAFLEYAAWDVLLSDAEIKEISKIPSWDLRYDIATGSTSWKQIPYTSHMPDNKIVQDNTTIGLDWSSLHSDIQSFNFAAPGSKCYNNTHSSIKLGTLSPGDITAPMFKRFLGFHAPINGYPVVYRYGGTSDSLYDDLNYFEFEDNNSLDVQLPNSYYMLGTERFHVENTGAELQFRYKAAGTAGWIELRTGAFSHLPITDTCDNYSRILRITSATTFQPFIISNVGNRYDRGSKPLPFALKDGEFYTLQMKVQGDITSTSWYLTSKTDRNYIVPVFLFKEIGFTLGSYGFATNNFNDITAALNYPYEDLAVGMFSTTKDCKFKFISANFIDSNSFESIPAGYIPESSKTLRLYKTVFDQVSSVELSATLDTSDTELKVFFQFGEGTSWKKFNFLTDAWEAVDETDYTQGMDAELAMALTNNHFEKLGGVNYDENLSVRLVLHSNNANFTPKVSSFNLFYNGPTVIDSWDEPGTFYNGSKFYYQDTGAWSPLTEPDFLAPGQAWVEMGSDVPDSLDLTATNGSPASTSIKKVYAGTKQLLVPKGKWYWRIAAYNGV